MQDQKNKQRVLPLEKKYMEDKKVDYKLYSFFQSISYLSQYNERFVYKTDDPELGKLTQENLVEIFNDRCTDLNERISLSTLKRRMQLYKSLGLIEENSVIDMTGKKVKCYILVQNFEVFQYVPFDTLKYLANTASSNVITIYAYLLSKFLWKQKTGEMYSFTLGELAEAIGIKDYNNGNTRVVNDCLSCLLTIGLIGYVQYYEENGSGMPSPKMRLTFANFYCNLKEPEEE